MPNYDDRKELEGEDEEQATHYSKTLDRNNLYGEEKVYVDGDIKHERIVMKVQQQVSWSSASSAMLSFEVLMWNDCAKRLDCSARNQMEMAMAILVKADYLIIPNLTNNILVSRWIDLNSSSNNLYHYYLGGRNYLSFGSNNISSTLNSLREGKD